MSQPPRDPREAEQQHGDADRLVQLEGDELRHRTEKALAPTNEQIGEDRSGAHKARPLILAGLLPLEACGQDESAAVREIACKPITAQADRPLLLFLIDPARHRITLANAGGPVQAPITASPYRLKFGFALPGQYPVGIAIERFDGVMALSRSTIGGRMPERWTCKKQAIGPRFKISEYLVIVQGALPIPRSKWDSGGVSRLSKSPGIGDPAGDRARHGRYRPTVDFGSQVVNNHQQCGNSSLRRKAPIPPGQHRESSLIGLCDYMRSLKDGSIQTIQVRDAKARFSELVAAAERGEPTTITKHGQPAAVVVPVEMAKQLYPTDRRSFADVLLAYPGGAEFERDTSPLRDIDL